MQGFIQGIIYVIAHLPIRVPGIQQIDIPLGILGLPGLVFPLVDGDGGLFKPLRQRHAAVRLQDDIGLGYRGNGHIGIKQILGRVVNIIAPLVPRLVGQIQQGGGVAVRHLHRRHCLLMIFQGGLAIIGRNGDVFQVLPNVHGLGSPLDILGRDPFFGIVQGLGGGGGRRSAHPNGYAGLGAFLFFPVIIQYLLDLCLHAGGPFPGRSEYDPGLKGIGTPLLHGDQVQKPIGSAAFPFGKGQDRRVIGKGTFRNGHILPLYGDHHLHRVPSLDAGLIRHRFHGGGKRRRRQHQQRKG